MQIHIKETSDIKDKRIILECSIAEIFTFISNFTNSVIGDDTFLKTLSIMSILKCSDKQFIELKDGGIPEHFYLLFKCMREVFKSLSTEESQYVAKELLEMEIKK